MNQKYMMNRTSKDWEIVEDEFHYVRSGNMDQVQSLLSTGTLVDSKVNVNLT
jgi:hypothetical protein